MSKDIQRTVVRPAPEVALGRPYPTVDDIGYLKPAFTKPERARFLFAPITRVTLNFDAHGLIMLVLTDFQRHYLSTRLPINTITYQHDYLST
ncbi:MAG: hypothetical protein JSW48_11140, partial [Betaproteobacteria bacterium]